MKLDLSTPVKTEQLEGMLGSVGAGSLLSGTVYTPILQTLIAPASQGEDSVAIWELSQKIYSGKGGEIELTDAEVKILVAKTDSISFPWLRARIRDLLK